MRRLIALAILVLFCASYGHAADLVGIFMEEAATNKVLEMKRQGERDRGIIAEQDAAIREALKQVKIEAERADIQTQNLNGCKRVSAEQDAAIKNFETLVKDKSDQIVKLENNKVSRWEWFTYGVGATIVTSLGLWATYVATKK